MSTESQFSASKSARTTQSGLSVPIHSPAWWLSDIAIADPVCRQVIPAGTRVITAGVCRARAVKLPSMARPGRAGPDELML
jgi:hypothetical protein